MAQDPNDFLMGSGGSPSLSFLTVGARHKGTILEEPQLQQQKDLATGALKTWDDGNPQMMLVVTLQTDERDPSIEDDTGKRRLFIASYGMRKSIADAVRKVGAKGLEVGGFLDVTYTGDGKQEARGLNPPKNFEATYAPPNVSAGFLNGASVQPTEPPRPSYQPTVVASPPSQPATPQFSAEQLEAMTAAGVDVSKFVSV